MFIGIKVYLHTILLFVYFNYLYIRRKKGYLKVLFWHVHMQYLARRLTLVEKTLLSRAPAFILGWCMCYSIFVFCGITKEF